MLKIQYLLQISDQQNEEPLAASHETPKHNAERMKLEHSSAIAAYVLEIQHHMDFEILRSCPRTGQSTWTA